MKPRSKTILSIAFVFFILFSFSETVNAYEFPPYQGITLKVLGDISGDYSNNVTYASDKENRVEDFRTMLNLGLDVQYRGKKRTLGLSGRAIREIFEDKDAARNPSEKLILSFSNEITKYDRISLRNNFSHTQEPGRFVGGIDMNACEEYYENYGYSESESQEICNEFNDEFGRFRGRFDSYRNNLNFSYTREIGEKVSITPNYAYAKNWSTEEGTQDSISNIFGTNLNYIYSQSTSYRMSYIYQVSKYDIAEELSRKSINAGIRHYLTKRFAVNVNVGKDIVSNGNNSISVNASLMSEIDKKTYGRLLYTQGTEISANANTTFKNWRLTGNLTRSLMENVNGNVSAFYGVGKYSPTAINDTLLGANINLSYVFWQGKRGSSMKGNLGYSYSKLNTNNENRNYKRNSVKFGLALAI